MYDVVSLLKHQSESGVLVGFWDVGGFILFSLPFFAPYVVSIVC